MRHLALIYFVNAGAILAGLVLFDRARTIRRAGDELALRASRVLAQLEEGIGASLKPDLVYALNEFAERVERLRREDFDRELGRLDNIVERVEKLVEVNSALSKGVEGLSASGLEAYEALAKQNSALLEGISERLDKGFQLLAAESLAEQAAIQELKKATEALSSASKRVADIDLGRAMVDLSEAISRFAAGAASLPQELSESISGGAGAVREASRAAFDGSVRETLVPALSGTAQELRSGLTDAVREVREASRANVAEPIAAAVAPSAEALTQHLRELSKAVVAASTLLELLAQRVAALPREQSLELAQSMSTVFEEAAIRLQSQLAAQTKSLLQAQGAELTRQVLAAVRSASAEMGRDPGRRTQTDP